MPRAAGAQSTGMVKGKVDRMPPEHPSPTPRSSVVQKGNKSRARDQDRQEGRLRADRPQPRHLRADRGKGRSCEGTLETQVHLGDRRKIIEIKIGRCRCRRLIRPPKSSSALRRSRSTRAWLLSKAGGKHDEAIAKFTETLGLAPNCQDCYYYNIGVQQHPEEGPRGGR